MHTEFEELVRDSMERFTEGLPVPADLAGTRAGRTDAASGSRAPPWWPSGPPRSSPPL